MVISDHSEIPGSTAAEEQYLGRKMGAYNQEEDVTGVIDAVMLIKDPRYVFDEPNSYWFKCLIKSRMNDVDNKNVRSLANTLHGMLALKLGYAPKIGSLRHGDFRALTV